MYIFVRFSARKYMVVKVDGHYDIVNAKKVDREQARTGKIVCGPTNYDEAINYFTDHTQRKEE